MRRVWVFLLPLVLLVLWSSVVGAQASAAAAEPLPYPDCRDVPWQMPPPIWQARLQAAARAYIADTPAKAQRLARRLRFTRFPSPSNMCGPLTLAILRTAGLVPPTTPLRAFWLLNPRLEEHVIRRVLPPTRFCHSHFSQPLDQFDFRAFPLAPGDVLYLYAGRWDTFEHVLVVDRVDEQGRAYAVTNLNLAAEGVYVVREVLLYDPQRPGIGQISVWTDREHAADIGVTGHGGFDLWRPLWRAFAAKQPRRWLALRPRTRRAFPFPR